MAYRGRLLVELQSKLGEEIDKELEEIRPDELIRVQVSINLGVLFLESEALRSSENKIDIDVKLLVCLFLQRETDRGK